MKYIISSFFLSCFLNASQPDLYALIGGPSFGKTSILEQLEKLGHVTCKEAATDLILDALSQGNSNPFDDPNFEIQIFEEKMNREHRGICRAIEQNRSCVFVDRGLHDNLVYLAIFGRGDSSEYQYIADKINSLNGKNRYRAIFYIEPWNQNYFEANKEAYRKETTEESFLIGEELEKLYSDLDSPMIRVPGGLTPAERAHWILNAIRALP